MEKKLFTGPDLHAERNRDKIKDYLPYPDKDIYGVFARMKEQYPQLACYKNREIAKWIELYNQSLAQEVINSRRGVTLPQDIGIVFVSSCMMPEQFAMKNINFATSKKLGVVVPYTNRHSDGYVAKIHYYNNIPWHRFENHYFWTFKPCRKLQRAVAAEFKQGKQHNYRQFTTSFGASYVFHKHDPKKPTRKQLKVEKERLKEIEEMKHYNPFDFTDIPD